MDYGEEVEKAAIREALEELNIDVTPISILGVYSSPTRDPRKHVISIVFICEFKGNPFAGDDAASFEWIPLNTIKDQKLAFDHRTILLDYINWKNKPQVFWSLKSRS